ncbi:Periplasmic nitrate reductase protein NapE [Pseudovibrio axinellae]|uniref:Periplasmic nitrate reductase protein NapE n=1 Tax=Pseudovibrio axinellae TaxID=989403 RepID=A0A165T180_9HYPH|nr:periplasmic nitrate reductase, NapE protein [Pseudovibrio axinellae]KZL05157.1 Periplasmic nitrate reductase protein NapE [Pseudovibrio axinellae]SER50411.1 periplasmic nitrate reductase subunit NapE [Pseudovibrio axinellae]
MAEIGLTTQEKASQSTKSGERTAFLLLAVVLAPFLMTAAVAGYGFIIWMSQLLVGPPSF